MAKKNSSLKEKDLNDILMAAAQAAYGYIYYEFKMKLKDGSRIERIDVYEKYQRPSKKSAAILKEYGIETKMHRHS